MSYDGPCRKCDAGEPHSICGEPSQVRPCRAEDRRAMLLDKYAHRIKDMSAAGNGLLIAEIAPVLGELLAEATAPQWERAGSKPDWIKAVTREQARLTEDELVAVVNAAADTLRSYGPAPRSCPTCGPCPGGPGSTPLNETDALCWRCGRRDLVSA